MESNFNFYVGGFTGWLFDQTRNVLGICHLLPAYATGKLFQYDAGTVLFRNIRRPTVLGLQHGRCGENLLKTG
jgi:hypothetical protein